MIEDCLKEEGQTAMCELIKDNTPDRLDEVGGSVCGLKTVFTQAALGLTYNFPFSWGTPITCTRSPASDPWQPTPGVR